MYRYTVDNSITYTPEDLVLFRDSPFGCWMERLSLENPDHGILPDVDSSPPRSTACSQADIAHTLRTEGRRVTAIAWDLEESQRRRETLEAMRRGVDFIVDGQLALGSLSGTVNLLMRTSGYSDLGKFLYIPCDTQGRDPESVAFRLCFLADLLHGLQGQLPPQLLLVRNGSEVVPLQTDEHIYYYRAVKQRFVTAMREFRRAEMPDPAESSRFGRWSECASEVLRQRAQQQASAGRERSSQEGPGQEGPGQEGPGQEGPGQEGPGQARPDVATWAAEPETIAEAATHLSGHRRSPGPAAHTPGGQIVSGTLAEQARRLKAGAYSTRTHEWSRRAARDYTADNALQNLEFIGSDRSLSHARSEGAATAGREWASDPFYPVSTPRVSPPGSELPTRDDSGEGPHLDGPAVRPQRHPAERPGQARPGQERPGQARPGQARPAARTPTKAHPLDSEGFSVSARGAEEAPQRELVTATRGLGMSPSPAGEGLPSAADARGAETDFDDPAEDGASAVRPAFSSHLITGEGAFEPGMDPLGDRST